jgi:hypothetical protein
MLIALLGAAAGCTTPQPTELRSVSSLVEQQTSDVEREVADASLYNNVLEPFAVSTVTLLNPGDHVTDEELLRVVNSEFTGKIEDLVSLIAQATGYRVIADGEKPGAPIVIVLVQQDLPAMGALREGFHQAKGRARLTVDQRTRTMTIHYARPERSPVPHREDREV